ncbi:hypothetical protein CMUS01_10629 [Colletotrichum musicola]|uniref:Uncharacterized protein n=1 Tax=Colletotrichum musicola TaxID=2175873 RepID=A0A8H6N7Z4_9PEZI|nr:hypothetical protein CMUS01_10629 [Colletotrichum musicola]
MLDGGDETKDRGDVDECLDVTYGWVDASGVVVVDEVHSGGGRDGGHEPMTSSNTSNSRGNSSHAWQTHPAEDPNNNDGIPSSTQASTASPPARNKARLSVDASDGHRPLAPSRGLWLPLQFAILRPAQDRRTRSRPRSRRAYPSLLCSMTMPKMLDGRSDTEDETRPLIDCLPTSVMPPPPLATASAAGPRCAMYDGRCGGSVVTTTPSRTKIMHDALRNVRDDSGIESTIIRLLQLVLD